MQLPEELQTAISRLVENSPSLRKSREALSQTYREGRNSQSIFSDEAKGLAYLVSRMPATYAAVHSALKAVLEANPFRCEHLLDLGAGPGTASWAALEWFPDLKKITLVEQSPQAIEWGKALSNHSPAWEWLQQSLEGPLADADVAIVSYALGELRDPEKFIQRLWETKTPCIIIVEPGTPRGFNLIRKIRSQLLEMGAFIAAPCPHSCACPIQGSDWCHFSARVERSRLHRHLKEGTLGYEDEKFSYLAVSKTPVASFPNRIIRHPAKLKGHVRLTLCTERGNLEERVVTRKDKEIYRKARDAEWGCGYL